MPALLPGNAGDGSEDRIGMKWVSGNPANNAAGLAGIYGLLLLNDPITTVPIAILDAGPITAERTAAISGVAMRAFAPAVGGAPRVALIGAGVQGRSHVPVLGFVLPGADLAIYDRDPGGRRRLRRWRSDTDGIGSASVAASARDAVEGADVVVTVASFVPPPERQVMTNDWLSANVLGDRRRLRDLLRRGGRPRGRPVPRGPHRAVPRQPRHRQLRRVPGPDGDDRRGAGDGVQRPAGRVVVAHLGTGLADVVFGSAILEAAAERGLGTILPR